MQSRSPERDPLRRAVQRLRKAGRLAWSEPACYDYGWYEGCTAVLYAGDEETDVAASWLRYRAEGRVVASDVKLIVGDRTLYFATASLARSEMKRLGLPSLQL